MARELGFDAAVTAAFGGSSAVDDLFQLPRFTTWDPSVLRWMLRLVLDQRNARFKWVGLLPQPAFSTG